LFLDLLFLSARKSLIFRYGLWENRRGNIEFILPLHGNIHKMKFRLSVNLGFAVGVVFLLICVISALYHYTYIAPQVKVNISSKNNKKDNCEKNRKRHYGSGGVITGLLSLITGMMGSILITISATKSYMKECVFYQSNFCELSKCPIWGCK